MQSKSWAGAAVYSPRTLRLYDVLVLALSNRVAWKCSTRRQLAFFQAHLSGNHLDVGVGSGYYPSASRFPGDPQRLVLMDLNPDCLAFAAERIARAGMAKPACQVADVLSPIAFRGPGFDSISLFYLLHCVPGTMAEKAAAIGHLADLLNPGGTLYGTTILGKGQRPNAIARRLMAVYNSKQIFSNRADDAETLKKALDAHLGSTSVAVVGEVALFSGIKAATGKS